MKNFNRKGFTLVEVIVVLVILAILIAIAVPSVMKYIDEAKDAQVMAQAKGVVQEVELYSTELFAKQECKTSGEIADAIDEMLLENGYGKIYNGGTPIVKDGEWYPSYVFSVWKNMKFIGNDKDSLIDYSSTPRVQKIFVTMQRKVGGSTESMSFTYTPNESMVKGIK